MMKRMKRVLISAMVLASLVTGAALYVTEANAILTLRQMYDLCLLERMAAFREHDGGYRPSHPAGARAHCDYLFGL